MDAALYLSLREEMQQDAVHVERQLDDLRKAESFLLRRIKTAQHRGGYRVVLNDLATEITHAESEHAELLHLSRFVTRCLIKTYADIPKSQQPVPETAETKPLAMGKIAVSETDPKPPSPLRDSEIGQAQPEDLTPRQDSPDQMDQVDSSGETRISNSKRQKTNGPMDWGNHRDTRPSAHPPRAGNTIEFDEEGFPILSGSRPNSSPPAEATEPQTGGEPPTVEFGADGFPLNQPPPHPDETIAEPPNPRERKPPKKAK